MYGCIKKPLVTEKNSIHSAAGVYVFEVTREARKDEIKRSVEKAFRVKVDSVRTMVCRGRARRSGQQAMSKVGYWKKALVKLKAGEKIGLFEGA